MRWSASMSTRRVPRDEQRHRNERIRGVVGTDGGHRAIARVHGSRPRLAVPVVGTRVLPRLAGCESPLQADRDWSRVGGSTAAGDDADLHAAVQSPVWYAVRRVAVSDFFIRRVVAVDVLFAGHQ